MSEKIKYIFGKEEKLCGLKEIDELFRTGKWRRGGCLSMIYKLEAETVGRLPKVLISVPKRTFKRAVKRNLLKRRIREAYRLNKHLITGQLLEKGIHLNLGFIYSEKKEVTYQEIEREMLDILFSLKKILEK